MIKKQLLLLVLLFYSTTIFSLIQTKKAFFIFDNGEKNIVASMLAYAEQYDKKKLDSCDFKIIFMGSAVDAMGQLPFSRYPERLVHYSALGIEEIIDKAWKRDQPITQESLDRLSKNLLITDRLWVGVSCFLFKQILQQYQAKLNVKGVALRDNPNPDGETDYFSVAKDVQDAAEIIVLPSRNSINRAENTNKKIVVVGHAPTEDWVAKAKELDKQIIFNKLGLDQALPVLVYAGVYGDLYEAHFRQFLEYLKNVQVMQHKLQVIIVPHPRYKGEVEKKLGAELIPGVRVVGEWESGANSIKTIEALAIADLVITADATSTIVFQANGLKKRVIHIGTTVSNCVNVLYSKKMLKKITCIDDFIQAINTVIFSKKEKYIVNTNDVFDLFEIPRSGSELLWQAFFTES